MAPATSRVQLVNPIELDNVVLYGLDGKPARTYRKVIVEGEAVKDADDNYVIATQDEHIERHRREGTGMLSYPLAYAVIERCYDEGNRVDLNWFIQGMLESMLVTDTRILYDRSRIIHGYGSDSPLEVSCFVPIGSHNLNDIKNRKKWQTPFQGLFMPQDQDKAVEILNTVARVPAHLCTAIDRETYHERPAFLGGNPGCLLFDCTKYYLSHGRSRRVILEE